MAIRLHSRSGGTAARPADSRRIAAAPAADNRRIAAAVVSAVAAAGVGRIAVAGAAADNRLADTALVAVVAVVEAVPLALGVGASALVPRPLSPG